MREKLNCPLSEMNEALQKEKGLGNGGKNGAAVGSGAGRAAR